MRRPLRPAPLVDAWFDLLPPPQQVLARELHAVVLAAAPALRPAVRWGTLTYLGADSAPVLTLAPRRHQLQLQVLQGAALAARFPQLQGSAPQVRHLPLRYGHPVDRDLVRALVEAALQLGAPRRRGP